MRSSTGRQRARTAHCSKSAPHLTVFVPRCYARPRHVVRAVSPGPARGGQGRAPTGPASSAGRFLPRRARRGAGIPQGQARRRRVGSGVRALARAVRGRACIRSLIRLITADAAARLAGRTPLVLVALGGYGRGELHPSSDIDLMVVHDGELTPYVQRVTQELLYTLWDLGLQIGHSLRSLDDCVAMARTDLPSRTSMQEARLVAGDRRLFARFRPRAPRERVPPRLRAVPGRHAGRARPAVPQVRRLALHRRAERQGVGGRSARHAHGDVAGRGQVRGAHAPRALRQGAHHGPRAGPGRRGADLPLARAERAALPSGHKNDVLGRELQPRIAKNLGYVDDAHEPRGRALHARLLPARPRHPPRLPPAHRALPGDAVAAGRRGAPRAPAGAGRRARLLRRAPAPRAIAIPGPSGPSRSGS